MFAAYVEMTDHEIGRVIDAIDATGELDNTLIFYVATATTAPAPRAAATACSAR